MFVKITRALDGNSISGKMAVAAKQGQLVQIKGSSLTGSAHVFVDANELELATGRRVFVLERDVLNATEIPLASMIFHQGLLTPELVGNYVSARQVQEMESEGSDYIDTPASVAIATIGATNPGTINTAAAHGIADGETVVIAGVTGGTAGVNGTHVATVTDADTFTIPVNISSAGTGGAVTRLAPSATTTVGTELTSRSGKWAVRTSPTTQELAGIVRGVLAPEEGGAVRLLIEVMP